MGAHVVTADKPHKIKGSRNVKEMAEILSVIQEGVKECLMKNKNILVKVPECISMSKEIWPPT